MPPIFAIAWVAFLAAILMWSLVWRKKLLQKIQSAATVYAAQNGLTCYPTGLLDSGVGNPLSAGGDLDPIVYLLQDLPFFANPGNVTVTDLIMGIQDGLPVYMFLYTKEPEKGARDRAEYRYGVTAVRVPQSYSVCEIVPDNALNRVAHALGAPDIQFESDEFNQKYVVAGPDRDAIITMIDPQVIKYLMAIDVGYWLTGPSWLASVQFQVYDPAQWHREFKRLAQFNELVPKLVKGDTATGEVLQKAEGLFGSNAT